VLIPALFWLWELSNLQIVSCSALKKQKALWCILTN